jgi:hypothetical protein
LVTLLPVTLEPALTSESASATTIAARKRRRRAETAI